MNYIFSIFLCCSFLFAQGQDLKERRFANTVDSVIMYYTNKDSVNFSHFIDTSIGVYILYNTESGNRFANYKILGFSQSFCDNNVSNEVALKIMNDSLKLSKLIYATLPEYQGDGGTGRRYTKII